MRIDKDNWCGSLLMLDGIKDLSFNYLKKNNIVISIANDSNIYEQLIFGRYDILYNIYNNTECKIGIGIRLADNISYSELEINFLSYLTYCKSDKNYHNDILFNLIYQKYYDKILFL